MEFTPLRRTEPFTQEDEGKLRERNLLHPRQDERKRLSSGLPRCCGAGAQDGSPTRRRSQVTESLEVWVGPGASAGQVLKAGLQYKIICPDGLGPNAAEWDQKWQVLLLSTKHI